LTYLTDCIAAGIGRNNNSEKSKRTALTYITQAKLIGFLGLNLLFVTSYGVYKLRKPEMLQRYGNFYREMKYEKLEAMYWMVEFLVRRLIFVEIMRLNIISIRVNLLLYLQTA